MPHFHKIEKPGVAAPGNSETSTLPGSSESEKTLPATPLSVNLEAADIPIWDSFAEKAMAALILDGAAAASDENMIAQLAFDQADAMMVERAKRMARFNNPAREWPASILVHNGDLTSWREGDENRAGFEVVRVREILTGKAAR